MPLRLPALAACVLALTACASPTPTSEGMIPAFTARGVRGPVHAQTVAVEVKDAKPIPDAALRQALADAIVMSKLFARVVDKAVDKPGNYLLTVSVLSVEQPTGRLSGLAVHTTVKMAADWTLRRADTKAPVWAATIRSEHTARPDDAIPGGSRLRIATEGAVRENIALGLDRIAKLSLQPRKAQAEPSSETPASFAYADPRSSGEAEFREVALPAGEDAK
jgi:hypothetical protein